MRACLVNKQGHERWTDDDRETAADIITVSNIVGTREYAYVGEFKTKHHSFRRYQEIVSDAPQ